MQRFFFNLQRLSCVLICGTLKGLSPSLRVKTAERVNQGRLDPRGERQEENDLSKNESFIKMDGELSLFVVFSLLPRVSLDQQE